MIYDFKVTDSSQKVVSLDQYMGKVLLIVNTATQCGLTPQYEGLQKLYDKYKSQGFEILDFPCNQFLNQAPGSDEEISAFCTINYKTTFPRFAKIDVNGKNADPLFQYLKKEAAHEEEDDEAKSFVDKLKSLGQKVLTPEIKWNFTKFLINKEGKVVKRYSPTSKPEDIEKDIEHELKK